MSFKNQLTIFLYHAVIRSPLNFYDFCFLDESSFRDQVKYIKRHFEVIPLSEAVERLMNGKLKRRTAVITFDDGLQNNYEVAYPILRKEALPATIFPVTGLVNTRNTVWFCRLIHALAETSKTSFDWDGLTFDLTESVSKAKSAAAILARLKEFSLPELLAELRGIIMSLGEDPDSPIEDDSPFRMLSHEAITEMLYSGLIEFGAHTHSHGILSLLSKEECRFEIEQSLNTIHELKGSTCKLFAYPNGRPQDYNSETIEALNACGVLAAVTSISGTNDEMTPVMELKRYAVGANWGLEKFKKKVHHIIAQGQVDIPIRPTVKSQ